MNAPPEKRLPGRTAAELLAEVPEKPAWDVPGLLAPGWVIEVAGREKLGKGTLELYLLGRLERGEATVFGPAAAEPVTAVIYTEEPSDSIREKVEASGLQRARIIYHHELAHRETWKDKVVELVSVAGAEGHGIVFVDNLSKATGIEDESGTELGRAAEALIEAIRASGLRGIFDHHHRKKKGAVEDMARGGTATGGAVDVIVDMRREGGSMSRKRKLTARGRLCATWWERVVELSEDGQDYTETAGRTDDDGAISAQEQRLMMDAWTLSRMGGEATAKSFADRLDLKTKNAARARLEDLVEDERVTVDKAKTPHVFRLVKPASEGDQSP